MKYFKEKKERTTSNSQDSCKNPTVFSVIYKRKHLSLPLSLFYFTLLFAPAYKLKCAMLLRRTMLIERVLFSFFRFVVTNQNNKNLRYFY
ncbi:transmembrane protein, putative [Bodo saltans]|uniref:Transmembrane protein, putative n=1 Tax=Bodo saltans TaxID=75058 RepID=A0A0S4JEH3_BODSA|nr:transmembrane protein, putative [Bodo saltans]|eukprot:CUG88844.1 transmembrane protein, putative [Bodo saltans]